MFNDFGSGPIFRSLAITTPAATLPVTLVLAKNQLRVEITDDDNLITGLIGAATDFCQTRIWRSFVTTHYQLRLSSFPFNFPFQAFPAWTLQTLQAGLNGVIKLPVPPLVSVDSISYTDANGNVDTLDPALYQVGGIGSKGRGIVTPKYGGFFPQVRQQIESVLINFTAGYGAGDAVPSPIPQGIQSAILVYLSYLYTCRTGGEGKLDQTLMTVDGLLSPYNWGARIA
jgi:hypothetical protein